MNFTAGWIISVCLLVVGFFGIIIFARLFSEPIDKEKFSFMRVFPYEAVKNNKYYEICCYLFALVCFSPFFVFPSVSREFAFLDQTSIFITCALGLAGLAFVFLNVFGANHSKAHIYLFGGFVIFTFFGSVLLFLRAVVAYSNYLNFGQKEAVFIVAEVLSTLVTAFILYIAFNPRLGSWAKLEKLVGDDLSYVRPKKFVLAYSEWAILLALFIDELIFFLELLV